MILVNGQPDDMLSIMDRGLQYGDGLFETMRLRQGQIEWLPEHLARLQSSCQRLNIDLDTQSLNDELNSLLSQLSEDCVIKIIITRGQGGRGYKPAINISATRVISTHPLPDYPDSHQQGIAVKICSTRLGIMPLLAGMKHLNRLEQVMASQELLESPTSVEGLMFDIDDNLIEGTMSNVFLVKQNKLLTPSLHNNGVAGVMRQILIKLARENNIEVNEMALTQNDVVSADELFICNSLFGIWPITHIINTQIDFRHGPLTKRLQGLLAIR